MFRWQWNYKFLLEIEIWGCFCYWWFVTFVLCPSNKHSNLEIVFWKKEYKVIYNLCYVKYRNFALQSAICSKLFINCAFPQNFHTSKLGEMLLFCALLHCMRCRNTEFFWSVFSVWSDIHPYLEESVLGVSKKQLFWIRAYIWSKYFCWQTAYGNILEVWQGHPQKSKVKSLAAIGTTQVFSSLASEA